MPAMRPRDEDSSTGSTIATVVLGAVAGFAVGMYVAQRMGGFAGIANRLRRRPAKNRAESYYEAAGEDFLDDDLETEADLEPEEDFEDEESSADSDVDDGAPVLEERVLEAFNNDLVLAECAIDIGAIGGGAIELEGWVADDREAEHAVTIASGVPGVRSVANRLMVDDAAE
jgi:hypothetical protein